MKLFEDFKIKFEQPNWARDPELGLIDTILDKNPFLYKLLSADVTKGCKGSVFGRGDTPSVEQIVRAAIYKELKGLDYRELAYHQIDSRICALFIKIDELRPYSFQMYQKYISKIKQESLQKLLVELNKIAISEGLEDIEKFRQDSTVVKTNIHHPTNNSLIWDCIKESHRLLKKLSEEVSEVSYRDYLKTAKKTYYKINNTKSKDKQEQLFKKQLITFTKSINQISNVVKKKPCCSIKSISLILNMEKLLPLMKQVYDIAFIKQIKGEEVPNDEKLFSIYELHTDIIVKGGRDVKFGHKVNLSTGKSPLILTCDILRGNPSDTQLYGNTIDKIENDYGIVPRDSVTDGGFASKNNLNYAKEKGIINIVFNKIVGSMKNEVSSLNMETRLKKWRSGMEAVISNVKRKFDLFMCNWKGWEHFCSKILWSVIAYNIRVMARLIIKYNFNMAQITCI
ncbi:MAG: ISNCY family transposase [Bacteroidales bacterium]|nr:ISNCY family transposase [Bacteroidales bacterium]